MELRTLQYFITVAREGNITKAAQILHITQPALSIQLKELETELGVSLLHRGSRKITLTTEGQFLFNKAREILGMINTTLETLEGFSEISGTLLLGGTDSEYNVELFKVFKCLHDKYPQILLNFLSGTIEDTFQRLDRGDIDFAIILGDVDTEKYNTLALPWHDTFSLLVPASSPLFVQKSISLNKLNDMPLILPNHPSIRKTVAGWLNCPLDQLNVAAIYTFPFTALSLVEAGLGIALCKDSILNTKPTDMRFIPLEMPLSMQLHLLWRRDSPLNQVALLFLDSLQKAITPHSL